MMSKFQNDFLELNTTPLLNELNDVLNKGVKDILKDILKRHELLEQTHQAILNLPNIKGYINQEKDLDFDELDDIVFDIEQDNVDKKFEVNFEHNVSDINNLTRDEFINYQKSTNDIIDKLVSQIDSLKNEIKDLRKPVIYEKENIRLEIQETDIQSEKDINIPEFGKHETEQKDEIEEDEEVEEDEVEEDDVEEDEVEEDEVEEEVKSVETETKKDEDEEDEEELIEIEIDDKTYCTNDDNNGFIYDLDSDGDVGKKVGYLKDGDAYFY